MTLVRAALPTPALPGAIDPRTLDPVPPPRRPRRRSRAAAAWFVASLAVYLAAGVVLVLRHDGLFEDALARVSAASSVWSSTDPKLAAVGFVWTPLPALLMVPFTPLRSVFPALVSEGYVAALVSALATAAAVTTTWGLLGDLRVRPAARATVTALFALSPIVLVYAANGMTEALLVAFLLAACRRLLRWVREPDAVGLAAAGLFLGLGYLARYEALVAAAAATVVVAAVTAVRPGTLASTARRRDAVVVDVLLVGGPTVLAFGLWAFTSWSVVGSPFEQFTSAYGNSALLTAAGGTVSAALPAAQLVALAPALVPVLLLAALVAVRRRWEGLALLVVPVALFGSVLTLEWGLYLSGHLFGFLRYQITAVPLVVVLLGLVLSRGTRSWWRAVVGTAVGVTVLGAGIVTSAVAILGEPVAATQEYHRIAPLVEPVLRAVAPGRTVGVPVAPGDSALGMWASDREVAAGLDAAVEAGRLGPGSVLVDAGSGFAVVAASRHPEQFLITSDDGFDAALADPPGQGIRVVLRNDGGGVDAVRARWSSFGTPSAPGWVRPLTTVAPATRYSYAWSLWAVSGPGPG